MITGSVVTTSPAGMVKVLLPLTLTVRAVRVFMTQSVRLLLTTLPTLHALTVIGTRLYSLDRTNLT